MNMRLVLLFSLVTIGNAQAMQQDLNKHEARLLTLYQKEKLLKLKIDNFGNYINSSLEKESNATLKGLVSQLGICQRQMAKVSFKVCHERNDYIKSSLQVKKTIIITN